MHGADPDASAVGVVVRLRAGDPGGDGAGVAVGSSAQPAEVSESIGVGARGGQRWSDELRDVFERGGVERLGERGDRLVASLSRWPWVRCPCAVRRR